VKEEDRLIATIAEIDEQTSLVPRGAFVLEPTGHVNINRCFEGPSQHFCSSYTVFIISFHWADILFDDWREVMTVSLFGVSRSFVIQGLQTGA